MIPKRVRCPQCGNLAEYVADNPSRPFCSERCKLIDLGAWAAERYSIPGAPALTDSNELFSDAERGNPADEGLPPATSHRRRDS